MTLHTRPKSHAGEGAVPKHRRTGGRPASTRQENRLPVKYYTALEKQGGGHERTQGRIQEPDEDKAVAVTGAKTRRTKPEESSDVKICGTHKKKANQQSTQDKRQV